VYVMNIVNSTFTGYELVMKDCEDMCFGCSSLTRFFPEEYLKKKVDSEQFRIHVHRMSYLPIVIRTRNHLLGHYLIHDWK
jgi:hypothetical protein